MTISLQGKVALVTGATRGIGKAIALRLAKAGADLSICGRDVAKLSRCQKEVETLGRRCLSFKADISNPDEVNGMVNKTLDKFGKIDILINNAGITQDELLVRMKDEDWKSVLDTNLTGVFWITRAVSKAMLRAHAGRIVNISSTIALTGNEGQANYAASKAGLLGLTKSVARELASRGITCNAVAPGFIETDMTRQIPEGVRQQVLKKIPVGHFGTVNQVAALVLFLVSDEASYITGQVIRVDGGMVMS